MSLYAPYEVKMPVNYGDSVGGNTGRATCHMRVTFEQKTVIKSVFSYYNGKTGGESPLQVFSIFTVSNGWLLYEQNLWLSTTIGWQEVALDTPFLAQSGVQYSMGFRTPVTQTTHIPYDASGSASYLAGVSTPAGMNSIWWGQYYYTVTDDGGGTLPVTGPLSDTIMMQFGVDTNILPTAPTGVAAASVNEGTNSNVTWTHNDPDGNPQSKYQIRYRRV